jgi:hypothetical protein
LISDAAPPASTTPGNAFFATALQSQTTAAAVAAGILQPIVNVNGTGNTSGFNWGTMNNGAIVAVFTNAGITQPAIFHPKLAGNHIALLPFFAGPSLGTWDLVVFPTGEIVYQFVTDTNVRFLGAAYYDGSANPPKMLAAPINLGSSTTTGTAKNFITAGTGVLLGEVASSGSTNYEAMVINLFAGTATTPTSFVPVPFDGITNGILHEGGVFSRSGTAANFSVSDDQTRAIFVTNDPAAAGANGPIFRLHLVKLADGTQASLAGSERMLCAATGTPAPGACAPNPAGAAHYPRFVHSAPVYAGAAPAGTHQAVVWEEEEPWTPAAASRHARISLANFSGSVPAIGTVDRLTTYQTVLEVPPGGPSPVVAKYATEVESAAGGALYFLASSDLGGADLFMAPLAPSGTGVVASTRILDRVFGFKVREEKARILVARADGTLYFAPLAGGAAPPALTPIAGNGPMGDPQFNGLNSLSYGFTPDGDHAFVAVDQEVYRATNFNVLGYNGILLSINLASGGFASTDWGRVSYQGSTFTSGFIANASAAEIVDDASVDNLGLGQLTVATAGAPTLHGNTGLFAGDPASLFFSAFGFSPSLDDSEAAFVFAGTTNLLSANGTFLSLGSAAFVGPQQAATNSPFGGPYLPDYSQVNGSFFSGTASSLFKVFGTTAPGSAPPSFVSVVRGFNAAPSNGPAQTRQTPDNKELLYSFVNGGDGNGGYAIWLPLSGRGAPPPLLP